MHAIAAVDSEACLVDVEIAWRLEDARALAPRNRSALLETICALRQRLVVRGGSSRFIWCPAHVGIYTATSRRMLWRKRFFMGR